MVAGAARAAAVAALEGWRPPVQAALQPVLLLDDRLHLVAASQAANRLLGLRPLGRPLREAACFGATADDQWEQLPFVRAMRTGVPQRGGVAVPGLDGAVDVLVSPLFGEAGPIGAAIFLTAP